MAEDSTAVSSRATKGAGRPGRDDARPARSGQMTSPYWTVVPLLRVQITRVVLRGMCSRRRSAAVGRVRCCDAAGRVACRLVIRLVLAAFIAGLLSCRHIVLRAPRDALCRQCTAALDE